jgi:hypothetical protein
VTLFVMMDSAAPDDQTKGLKRFRANAGTHGAFRGAISHSIFADGARELETVTRTGRGDDHTRIIGKVAAPTIRCCRRSTTSPAHDESRSRLCGLHRRQGRPVGVDIGRLMRLATKARDSLWRRAGYAVDFMA